MTVAAPVRRPEPFVREAGRGRSVVCLHANASSSAQWRALMERLAPRFHVLAPDAYDAGQSPRWPSDSVIRLKDEVHLIEPLLERASAPLALVGHSYGAAVALIAALMHPGRIGALALYEPTLFSLIDAQTPAPNDADGIRSGVADVARALDSGNPDAAAQRFIDYWMGPGAWNGTPTERKPAIVRAIANIRRWGHALFREPTPLAAFGRLDIPVLYLSGRRSTASALGVARLLAPVLPRAEVLEFERLGHMGPVTHSALVNEAIARFLETHL